MRASVGWGEINPARVILQKYHSRRAYQISPATMPNFAKTAGTQYYIELLLDLDGMPTTIAKRDNSGVRVTEEAPGYDCIANTGDFSGMNVGVGRYSPVELEELAVAGLSDDPASGDEDHNTDLNTQYGSEAALEDNDTFYFRTTCGEAVLTKSQEDELAKAKDWALKEYRLCALSIPDVARRCLGVLHEVTSGTERLDRVIDVSVADTAEVHRLKETIRVNVRTVNHLIERNQEDLDRVAATGISEAQKLELREQIVRRQEKIASLLLETQVKDKHIRAALGTAFESGRSAKSPDIVRAQALQKEADAAVNKLVSPNARLVVSIAKKYSSRSRYHGFTLPDLCQEGHTGLHRAAVKYDYRHDTRFSTYATQWIKQAIARAIGDRGRTIRIPMHLQDGLTRIRECGQELQQFLGRQPSDREVFAALYPNEVDNPKAYKQFKDLVSANTQHLSLDMPVKTGSEKTFGDLFADSSTTTGEGGALAVLLSSEMIDRVRDVLAQIEAQSPRGRELADIIRMRYGIDYPESFTLNEVGRKYGVTRERIRQLEKSIFDMIKRLVGDSQYWSEIEKEIESLPKVKARQGKKSDAGE